MAQKELTFSSYAERRLQLALNHEFPTRGELESLIILLISESENFNPVDFGFLYHMIESSPIFGRADKIDLYRRLQALDIPVQIERSGKVSKHCTGIVDQTVFKGLFMPLNMPMLDILLASGWIPEVSELITVAGTPELRWVIERVQSIKSKWQGQLVCQIITSVEEPKRTAFLEYLFEIEDWDLSKKPTKTLQDTLLNNIDIYRKYKAHLCLFSDATSAITFLNNSGRRDSGAISEATFEALDIAAPKLRALLDPAGARANRRSDEGWGCLYNIAESAMRAGEMGLLERTMVIHPDQFTNPSSWRRARYLGVIISGATRNLRLDPWKLLFKYIPLEMAIDQYRRISKQSKFNKFAVEVGNLFRERYRQEPPARAGGRRGEVIVQDNFPLEEADLAAVDEAEDEPADDD